MTPFVRDQLNLPDWREWWKILKKEDPTITSRQAKNSLKKMERQEIWVNDTYQVNVDKFIPTQEGWPKMWHLSIKRHDKEPIFRDWRHFQAIKNEVCGPEHEGIELYPAESRVHDSANQYHMWVIAEAGLKFPVGWTFRNVAGAREAAKIGAKQRPFEE